MALGFRGMHTSVKGDVFWRFGLLTLFRRFCVTRTRASTCVNIQAPTQTHMRHIVQIYIYMYIYIYVCVFMWHTYNVFHLYMHTYTYIHVHIYANIRKVLI